MYQGSSPEHVVPGVVPHYGVASLGLFGGVCPGWCCFLVVKLPMFFGIGLLVWLGSWCVLPIGFVQFELQSPPGCLGLVRQLAVFLIDRFGLLGWPFRRLWCGGSPVVHGPQLIRSMRLCCFVSERDGICRTLYLYRPHFPWSSLHFSGY